MTLHAVISHLVSFYPPASKASKEVANLTKRKICIPLCIWCQRILWCMDVLDTSLVEPSGKTWHIPNFWQQKPTLIINCAHKYDANLFLFKYSSNIHAKEITVLARNNYPGSHWYPHTIYRGGVWNFAHKFHLYLIQFWFFIITATNFSKFVTALSSPMSQSLPWV